MLGKVLLVTTVRWPSACRIAGAFKGVGCEVHAVYPKGHVLALSRHVARSHLYDPLRGDSSFRAALKNSTADLVVPLDDRSSQLLAGLAETSEFAEVIHRSLGNPHALPMLASRSEFITTARRCGIRSPETIAIASEAELVDELKRVGLPAFIKSDGSFGGDGVALVETTEEAIAAFAHLTTPLSALRSLARAMRRRDGSFLFEVHRGKPPSISIQACVAGTPATTSFACWQGRLLSAIHFDVVASHGARGPACVVRPVECPEMEAATARIAAHFHLSGLHGLDFIRDAEGRVHLIEMNPRATQTSYFALGPGRDPVAALTAAAMGAAEPDRPKATDRATIALFPQEWSRDPASPRLVSAYHDVPWDDPAVLHACLSERPRARTAVFTPWKPSPRRLQTP